MVKNPLLVVGFMAGLMTVGHVSTNIYMPSLPSMADFFSTNITQVQLTVSSYLAAFAVGQLIYGPLSDRFGRKPILIMGLVIFLVATVIILITPFFTRSIDALIILRVLQGLGASSGPIIARAILRDLYDRELMAKMMSYVAIAMALAPAFAPVLGGYLEFWFDWRASFLVILIFAATMSVFTVAALPETNRYREAHASQRAVTLITNFTMLTREVAYWRYTLIGSFVFAGMFAFMTATPFVVIDLLGHSAIAYGWLSLPAFAGYSAGSFVLSRMTDHITVDKTVPIGAIIVGLSAIGFFLVALMGVLNLFSIFVPLTVMAFGMAILFPSTMAGAVSIYPEIAGAGAALYGFFQMLFAAFSVWLTSTLGDGTHMPMVWVVTGSMLGASVIALVSPGVSAKRSAKPTGL